MKFGPEAPHHAGSAPNCGPYLAWHDGGDVLIVAEFPDRAPAVLSELSEDDTARKSHRKHVQVQA